MDTRVKTGFWLVCLAAVGWLTLGPPDKGEAAFPNAWGTS